MDRRWRAQTRIRVIILLSIDTRSGRGVRITEEDKDVGKGLEQIR